MPPEFWSLVGTHGLATMLVLWGVWFIQTNVWPTFKEHLSVIGDMVKALATVAENTTKTYNVSVETHKMGEELLARVPQRDVSREREAS